MSNRYVAVGLALAGVISWFAPGFNGFILDPSDVTDGEGRIAGAIFLVGAALIWFK